MQHRVFLDRTLCFWTKHSVSEQNKRLSPDVRPAECNRQMFRDLVTAHIAKTTDFESCTLHKRQMLADLGTMQTTEIAHMNSANVRFWETWINSPCNAHVGFCHKTMIWTIWAISDISAPHVNFPQIWKKFDRQQMWNSASRHVANCRNLNATNDPPGGSLRKKCPLKAHLRSACVVRQVRPSSS